MDGCATLEQRNTKNDTSQIIFYDLIFLTRHATLALRHDRLAGLVAIHGQRLLIARRVRNATGLRHVGPARGSVHTSAGRVHDAKRLPHLCSAQVITATFDPARSLLATDHM